MPPSQHRSRSPLTAGLSIRKPHTGWNAAFQALEAVNKRDGSIGLQHFKRVKQLGNGDVGMVDLVLLDGTDFKFAMKTLDKREMQERNKVGHSRRTHTQSRGGGGQCHLPTSLLLVLEGCDLTKPSSSCCCCPQVHRVLTEVKILRLADHPFVASLYCVIQTRTHLHFILEYCDGGEVYTLLNAQPNKRLKEQHVQFYGAEVLIALQYMHLQGVIYRDLKPENLLIRDDGHVILTDFDLSYAKGVLEPRVDQVPVQLVSPRAGAACQPLLGGRRGWRCREGQPADWPGGVGGCLLVRAALLRSLSRRPTK